MGFLAADTAALITALGVALAGILTSLATLLTAVRSLRKVHGATTEIAEASKVQAAASIAQAGQLEHHTEQLSAIGERQDRAEETMRDYIGTVNGILGGLAEVSQLAVPFMEDYRDRHPDVFGAKGRRS